VSTQRLFVDVLHGDRRRCDAGRLPAGALKEVDSLLGITDLGRDYGYPRRKAAMVALVFLQLIEESLAPNAMTRSELAEAALRIVERVANEMGGRNFYMLKTSREWLLRCKRDALIVSEFTGQNARSLALKHGLTEMRIRQIVEKAAPQLPSSGGQTRRRGLPRPARTTTPLAKRIAHHAARK